MSTIGDFSNNCLVDIIPKYVIKNKNHYIFE